MIRVLIVSPSMAVRAGLRILLSKDEQFQISGEEHHLNNRTSDGEKDIVIWSPAPISSHAVLISDISDFRQGDDTALLLIHDEPKLIEELVKFKARAWGLVTSEVSQDELIAAAKAVNEGLIVTYPNSISYLYSNHAPVIDESIGLVEPLTGRELEILQFMAQGLTNKQIAGRLGISSHTVKFHVSSIFSKMKTTNRTESVKLGLKMGLILM